MESRRGEGGGRRTGEDRSILQPSRNKMQSFLKNLVKQNANMLKIINIEAKHAQVLLPKLAPWGGPLLVIVGWLAVPVLKYKGVI